MMRRALALAVPAGLVAALALSPSARRWLADVLMVSSIHLEATASPTANGVLTDEGEARIMRAVEAYQRDNGWRP